MQNPMHKKYLARCFELAKRGVGMVSPNPQVGAVIVFKNRILGEGWHQKYGSAHAEVNAVASVKEADKKYISQSTIYVSLEPCNHHGQTPPCVDLILKNRIPKVVIGQIDPNPLVGGKGIKRLRLAGVEVVSSDGVTMSHPITRPFFTWIGKKRPHIILKWAQSRDGFLGKKGTEIPITNALSKRLVHKWRSDSDAILVGKNTVLTDNPKLDNRYWFGAPPLRVFFDKKGEIPLDFNIFDDKMPTWCIGTAQDSPWQQTHFLYKKTRKNQIPFLLEKLTSDKKAILFVEGGAATHQQFIEMGLWDEMRVLESVNSLKSSTGAEDNFISAPLIPKNAILQEEFHLTTDRIRIFAPK